MPQPPNVETLPVWLQIFVSVAFCLATLFIAAKGYKGSSAPPEPEHHPQQSDALHRLSVALDTLERTMAEHLFHTRQHTEISRELCQRLRELRERFEGE